MTPIPPWPQDFLMRVVDDTTAALQLDETPIRARAAASLGAHHAGIVTAEAGARAALDDAWDELAAALELALEDVELDYAQYPARIALVRAELARHGADAWIGGAVRARLAFDIGFDALGDAGELTDL